MIDLNLVAVPLILLLITVGFGFWIRNIGRPYNPVLFNIHKLVALAGVVLAALRVKSIFPIDNLADRTGIILSAAAISVVILFATGGVMSIREEEPGISLFIHRMGLVVLLLCLVGICLLV